MGLIDTLEASVKVLPPVKTRGEGHGIANSDIKNLRDYLLSVECAVLE